jgi:MFS family permease
MYPLDPNALRDLRVQRRSGIGPNVFFLGVTSLLTDISAEMVASVLPVYLVLVLRLTPLQYGLVDGLYQGAAVVARLLAGMLADRWQRQRDVAASGYALSAVCKLGLLAAGNAWGVFSAVLALDRIGKGIRTAPRDALISLSCAPDQLARGFGLHRAFDTAGALLGPLLAVAILALLPMAYDVLFVVSFCIAAVGVAVIVLFVREVDTRGEVAATPVDRPRLADALVLLRVPAFRHLVIAAAVLGAVTVGDSFFYLTLQRRAALPAAWFPLLFVATALGYLLLAIPAGRLADRIGRGRVFLLGHGLLALACAALLVPAAGWVGGGLSLLLLGAYYACTDGVLMAAASAFVPPAQRATGLALLGTATGLARLLASVLFGAVWQWRGIEFALALFTAGLVVAVIATARTWAALGSVR